MISSLLLVGSSFNAQNISGIINSYASVTGVSGTTLAVNSASAFHAGDRILLVQMKGASVDLTNTANFGDITTMGGAGTFEFSTIQSVTGNTITSASAFTKTYNFSTGNTQVVRVPKYCSSTVIAPLTCASWSASSGTGGILALEAGTLILNSNIDVSGKGFSGGNYSVGSFLCDAGVFAAAAGTGGGKKGESISAYVNGMNGAKGKQANGGGGANAGNSGGGGGANAGAGGIGGHQYSGCGPYDDRGIGGSSLTPSLTALFMGGGGGGGYQDNALIASNGGNGGGIIYIKANVIICNNHVISSNGSSVTIIADAEASGGGGAGGTIFIESNNITGSLTVKTDGGSGGSNNNSMFVSDCHGTGGGGGGGLFAFSGASLPSGIVHSSIGGPAGTVDNPSSSCFGTTNGAADGLNGTSLPNLPASLLTLTEPTLNLTQSNSSICKGESASFTITGATNFYWSTGSTSTAIVVSPTINTLYTVTGTGPNSCDKSVTTTLTVSACTGIDDLTQNEFNFYPNPTRGKLVVEVKNPVQFFICDGTGRSILETNFQKGSYTLDISHYSSGIYFIKTIDADVIKVQKLVKVD